MKKKNKPHIFFKNGQWHVNAIYVYSIGKNKAMNNLADIFCVRMNWFINCKEGTNY